MQAMHAGPLGTIQVLNGTGLKTLADQGVWGDGGAHGKWDMKLNCILCYPLLVL